MADAVWPVGLPQEAITAGLEETPPAVVVRSEMDVGPAKVRRRSTAGVRVFTLSLKLTRAQVATFDTFFNVTLLGGALAFTWKHPRTGNPIDYRIVGQPRYSPQAPRQTASLEIYDITSITLEALPGTEVTGPVDPPNPDEGLMLFTFPPRVPDEVSIEDFAADSRLVQTDWIIFDAAPPGMDELFIVAPGVAGVFEDDFLFTNPAVGIDQVDPNYDGSPTYETGDTADGSGGFGGTVTVVGSGSA